MSPVVKSSKGLLRKRLQWTTLPLLVAGLGHGCASSAGSDASESLGSEEPSELGGIESAVAPSPKLRVRVKQGELQGKLVENTREFLGIPYAKPPVGALRFMPPEPVKPWSGVRQAVEFGPSCLQPVAPFSAPGPQSEDCLTLNVYAPARGAKRRPVMVFIHGGAFVVGSSVQVDGKRLSEEGNAVVVTFNYRLGTLGLLTHASLDAQRDEPSGNDALRDQRLAIEWVRKNIEAFGGDSRNVTLFGQSAGRSAPASTCSRRTRASSGSATSWRAAPAWATF